MKRVPSQTLWFAQQFHRGPGLIRRIEWKPFAKLPEPSRFRHCVCLLNNKLYVLGGRKYYGALDILKSALRYVWGYQEGSTEASNRAASKLYFAMFKKLKVFHIFHTKCENSDYFH